MRQIMKQVAEMAEMQIVTHILLLKKKKKFNNGSCIQADINMRGCRALLSRKYFIKIMQ